MDDKEPIKMNAPATTSKETEESIKRGQEAIEVAKKTDPHTADQKEKDKKEEEDAEKWRNEG
jgi:hypothetical protein